ncbi:glycoside hydrolase family 2 protein [Rhodanobacter sp. A1T4]|uniref:beta-mannosidase n=1 Tax=Rhodanobacter sp. A1T4 TaxID=2723087 RepID=UPI00161E3FE7|nr:glycoside hydrolase family 2 protein [Rhodanobacter sp. A1T4]
MMFAQLRVRAHAGRLRGFLFGALLLPAAFPSLAGHAPLGSQSLDQGWQFRLAPGDNEARAHPDTTHWRPATVPGTVQTDLLDAGLVSDPFVRDNEAAIQWAGLADWQYRTTFQVDRATLSRDHLELVFDGLDTFAEVYLNGHKLISADNMFRRWSIPAKTELHTGSNTLEVRLYSPIKRLQPWLLKQPYALPGEFDSAFGDEPKGKQTANYIRKAQYQYGWDWGPRIVTEGIWQHVHLDSWDTLRVADFHVAQTDVSREAAQVDVQLEVQADVGVPLQATVEAIGPDGSSVARITREVTIDPGTQTLSLPLRIEQPRLWYPAGYGAQDMYTFRATLRDSAGELYRAEHSTGLRTVELRRRTDVWGKSFEFVVNGIPIFAKGANLIPFDSFPTRATEAQMRRVLESARDANMNMLRIWGGGYYQSDAFYAMADRLGLMIWQDFMFGGAIPPYDVAYRENTRAEAIEQVRRLRDHPSIVLWAGNNEVQTGWESWPDRQAFKKAISPDERERIVTGMVNLFGNVLRNVVTRYAPDVPYWASTPSTDYDGAANVPDDGDYHYWDVWSGQAKPVEEYLNITPRFQSEYGLQSFPVMRTIDAFTDPHDRQPESAVMRAHQKYDSGNGNQRLLLYIRRAYGEPKNFASFVYLSQVMQADGIQLAAEHLRASRPQAMGSLYWQLNDVWPGASWSSIDYFGRWKALQFHARRFYAPQLLAALRNNGTTTVSLVSDRTTAIPAHWRMRLMSFDGKVLSQAAGEITVAPLSSTQVASYTDAQLLHGADPHATFAVFEWLDGERTVSRNLVFFDQPHQLSLPPADIQATLAPALDGYRLTLTAGSLARDVWVSFGDLDAELSDNAFNLLPGETVTLTVQSKASLDALQHALSVTSLGDVMAAGAPQ